MRLGWNLAAGLASSLWTAVLGLALVPLYLRLLGIEAYGLIGFFVAMQAVLGLLDMGLAPTINREVARATNSEERICARDLLHTVAVILWGLAALIGAATVLAAPLIGAEWLNTTKLTPSSVSRAVMLMGLVVACRFPLGLYLGVLMGAQRLVAASTIEMLMVTLANVGALAALVLVDASIEVFFSWQAVVAILNVLVVRAVAWRTLREARPPRIDMSALRRVGRFSVGMGLTAVLGTVMLQSDKIILSKLVSLSDFGIYTIAGMAARSLYIFLTPTFNALYPRLSALHAESDETALNILYRQGTRILCAIIFPIAFFVSVFSREIFSVWIGDSDVVGRVPPVVALLMLGTALNGAMHVPYALQLAYGRSNISAAIAAVSTIVYLPLAIMLTQAFGIVGAAAAWALINAIYLFGGATVTHTLLLGDNPIGWIIRDVGLPAAISAVVVGLGGSEIRSLGLHSYQLLCAGAALSISAFVITILFSPDLARTARRLASARLRILIQS